MLPTLIIVILMLEKTTGSTETGCQLVAEKSILNCKFPENINSSQSVFRVFFHPENGSEEEVIGCTWLEGRLHCISQEGFYRKGPVSDTASMVVPTSYVNKTGRFRCTADGFTHDTRYCQYPERPGRKHFAACGANTTLSGPQVILNCTFSFGVDSFTVKQNSTVVASFKKSECQSSGPCRHMPVDDHDVFSITLDMPDYPHGELLCHPDRSLSGLQVNGCSVNMKSNPAESASIPIGLTVALSIGCLLILVSTVTCFMCMRRRRSAHRATSKELEPLSLVDGCVP